MTVEHKAVIAFCTLVLWLLIALALIMKEDKS